MGVVVLGIEERQWLFTIGMVIDCATHYNAFHWSFMDAAFLDPLSSATLLLSRVPKGMAMG